MHRLSTEARLVQRMLHDGAIESGEWVAIEMRGFAVDIADREQRVVGLVLEYALLTAIQPSDVGAADTRPRRNGDQPAIRQRHLGERIAVVQADTDRFQLAGFRHAVLLVNSWFMGSADHFAEMGERFGLRTWAGRSGDR